ncbi:MAG: 4-hydroxy-3-methylbut-2-enyl diphosphate reductase [Thermoleophilia bacterium]|nr:4-hydroxy-3-methylbut-2-enyl diphosphate reductase [Thermoleophilia bacterium]
MCMTELELILAAPRGYCAGVDRAVETVEQALKLQGAPVYVRKQIVHNLHVVADLETRGAIFVDDVSEVPKGATVVFSAHGVAPTVHTGAVQRSLTVIDATCPLVTKVHNEAKRYDQAGYHMLLIGHAEHEEVVGTMGEAPDSMTLVEHVDDVASLPEYPADQRLAYLTQTTLSVDETRSIIEAITQRYPWIESPEKGDICYATSNRQAAVKELAKLTELVLVIGSVNSSNSCRLVEVARDAGVDSYLIEDATKIDRNWIGDSTKIGITSGASAPERLVLGVIEWFREHSDGITVSELETVHEDVSFHLPRPIRRALAVVAVDPPASN